MNILPKSIQIDLNYLDSLSFFRKLLEIFDKSITSFNEIKYWGNSKNSEFL